MGKKKILVVDDEKDIVEIISELLEGDEYSTIAACDGRKALEIASQEPIDLIILDIKMPDIDGFGVIEALRDIPSLAGIPIVVLTATQMIQEIVDRLRKLGIQICLSKPFEPKDLIGAVAKGLKSGGSH